MTSRFHEGRDLKVESPQEGFYLRRYSDESQEIAMWEVHPDIHVNMPGESKEWIAVVTAGEFEFKIDNEQKNLFPTDIFQIPAQCSYSFRVVGDRTARLVLFRKA